MSQDRTQTVEEEERGSASLMTVPEENRFALSAHGGRIEMFRATGRGLKIESSEDGVRWRTIGESNKSAQRLWPLSSGQSIEGTALFCVNAAGAIVPIRREEGRLRSAHPLPPVSDTAAWYEDDPDPHDMEIVHDAERGAFRALFCARRTVGRQAGKRACVGTAVSADLSRWEVEPPIFAPNAYARLFSPHLYQEPGRCVLFYSTEEEGNIRAVRYALAPRPEGPYERTDPDLLCCDARALAHTVRLGERRLIFFARATPGELHLASVTRPGELDFRADGRPAVRFYDGLLNLVGPNLFQTEADMTSVETLARILPRHGSDARFAARVTSETASGAGLMFRADIAGHDNLAAWLDFEQQSVSLRRGLQGRLLARARRPLVRGAEYAVTVWVEGKFADVYIDGEWTLSGGVETRRAGMFGLAVQGGRAVFRDVTADAVRTD